VPDIEIRKNVMDEKLLVKKSKWLSKHLRHAPEHIGLELEAGGWVEVAALLAAARRANFSLSLEDLQEVVTRNDKQRFAFNESNKRIRANQGHSIEVDLQLEPQLPPDKLYHGSGAQYALIIESEGLKKMRRHHVHLSPDVETAWRVGARHGKPVVFEINAAQMHSDGFLFFVSQNGV
jgi:putative RNA 2'-phosphotransferase